MWHYSKFMWIYSLYINWSLQQEHARLTSFLVEMGAAFPEHGCVTERMTVVTRQMKSKLVVSWEWLCCILAGVCQIQCTGATFPLQAISVWTGVKVANIVFSLQLFEHDFQWLLQNRSHSWSSYNILSWNK